MSANGTTGLSQRERLLRLLAAATFVIFFQAYMVAPIVPLLTADFGTSLQTAGFIVPAYLIPYGVATLIYGILADRLGVRRVMHGSITAFAVLTVLTATAQTIGQITLWRLLTGFGAAGVVPLALILVGQLFPYEERGRPLGWIFGAMAGGMAFGSSFGAILAPFIGWQGLFIVVGLAGIAMLFLLLVYKPLASAAPATAGTLREVIRGYGSLLATARAQRTYGYVLVNATFHGGVFAWLGLYFDRRYGLGPVGIGLALLGYGVPGFLFGPVVGRAADRWGRARLLPIGLGLGAIGAAALLAPLPLLLAAVAVTVLSLGYDMTQPLLAGIVTSLGGKRPGQAMGLNVFALFLGFGLGALIFGALLRWGLSAALGTFAAAQAIAAMGSVTLFRSELPSQPATAAPGPLRETRSRTL